MARNIESQTQEKLKMRRILMVFVAMGLLIAATGCVAVSAKHNRFGCECQVVAAGPGERVFVVNPQTGEIREVDLSAAKPFSPCDKAENAEEGESD
jgi:hypothetical protein